MKARTIIVLLLVASLFLVIGCTQKPPAQPVSGTAEKEQAPPPSPKFDEQTTSLFKALEKFKPEDDFRFEKEFEALKARAEELAKKKDKDFIESLFIISENGKPIEKKAANELLCYVVSDYKGSDWADQEKYREKAITAVTSSPDPEFRNGCWGFLLYFYEPEKITPKILQAFENSKDKKLRLEILTKIGDSTPGAFLNKNEEALNKICLQVLKDQAESPEMKVAAVNILANTAKKDPEAAKELESLKNSPDEKLKEAAGKALEKLK